MSLNNILQDLIFLLSNNPTVKHFRWSPTVTYFSTWIFLITSITTYIIVSATLHNFLRLIRRLKPVSLGPAPAIHSLFMSISSILIFLGMLVSSVSEINDTKWFWRRSKTPFQWLLCFPLGTRPSGRVFFWSYMFYLSRFAHVSRTWFNILRNPDKGFPYFQVLNHCVLICMTFLWLEFSQSYQVLAILSMSLVFALVYAYRFCDEIGVIDKRITGKNNDSCGCYEFVGFCKIALVVLNLGWNIGVLVLHFYKGGCNGMGAWVFNSTINGFVLVFAFDYYMKKCLITENRDFDHEKIDEGKASEMIKYELLSSDDRS